MRRMTTVVTLTVLACLALAPIARGQDTGQPQRPTSRPDPLANLKAQVDKLGLTDDQKTKAEAIVTKAVADLKASTDANQPKIDDLRKQMQAARDANDDAKVAELRQEMGKLRVGGRDIVTKAEADLKALLTPDQLKKLDQIQFDARVARGRDLGSLALRNADKLTLTDDEKTKITALAKAFQDALAKITPGAADGRKQMQDLTDKLNTDVKAVLTDDQKAALDKIQADQPRGRGGFGNGGGQGRRGGNNGGAAPAPAAGGAAPAPAPAPAGGGDRI